jgi:ABC-type antimicrobial peptide transport system permease subunit
VPDVLRLVIGEGFTVALWGVALGAASALPAGRWIAPLLFDQSPRDPVVFGTVSLTLLLIAVLASAIPALRGARVQPSTVLRAEAG